MFLLEKYGIWGIIGIMKKMALAIILAACILAAADCGSKTAYKKIKVRDYIFNVEVADTNAARARGLGYRDKLGGDCGMLFIFDEKERYTFWMKGMRFPLDFLWIDGKTVADITEKVPAPAFETESLPVYAPRVPVDKILELNAGAVEQLGISVGDTVTFLK